MYVTVRDLGPKWDGNGKDLPPDDDWDDNF